MFRTMVDERQRRRSGLRARRAASVGEDPFRQLVMVPEGKAFRSLATRGDRRPPTNAGTEAGDGGGPGSNLERDEFLGASRRVDCNGEEARYSSHVRDALLGLLKGDRDELELLVKHHREPGRLGILAVPAGVDAKALRPSKTEEMLRRVLRFLHDGSSGGPISLSEDATQGLTVQTQDFATRFPHIVVQRTDRFDAGNGDPVRTNWSVRRLQNQRSSSQTNRTLDALNLGVEILKFVL